MLQIRTSIFDNLIKSLMVLAILLSPGLVFAQAEASEWSIEGYDVIIDVREDGTLDVAEEITVDFNVQKHGIFRTIPTTYSDEYNNRIKIGIEFGEILQDGEPAVVLESPQFNEKYLKIGDPDITIDGEHTYTINYSVNRGVLFFDEFDEIYWNVTGTEWEVPIEKSSAVVRLPDGVEILQTSCYTGEQGSTETDCGVATDDNIAAFAAKGNLTVAVGFPKGVVEEPTFSEKIGLAAKDNAINLIPFGIVAILFLFWIVVGRDPRMDTVIAEYDPPGGLSASSVGVIHKTFVASSDISAMIIQMAVDGYLEIEVERVGKKKNKRKIHLIRKKSASGLDETHQTLFEMIFKGKEDRVSAAELKRSVSEKKYKALKKQIGRILTQEEIYTKGSFRGRTILFIFGAIQLYGSFMAIVFFGPITTVLFVISALITFAFALLITKKTGHGTEVVRKIRGYRLYLNTAEKYRIEWQGKEGIFEKHLPYAIALGVTNQWASTFAGMEYQQPSWYHSTYQIQNYGALATDLQDILGALSATVTPHSSGSGGGGSSGGGMGGGGGGSW